MFGNGKQLTNVRNAGNVIVWILLLTLSLNIIKSYLARSAINLFFFDTIEISQTYNYAKMPQRTWVMNGSFRRVAIVFSFNIHIEFCPIPSITPNCIASSLIPFLRSRFCILFYRISLVLRFYFFHNSFQLMKFNSLLVKDLFIRKSVYCYRVFTAWRIVVQRKVSNFVPKCLSLDCFETENCSNHWYDLFY